MPITRTFIPVNAELQLTWPDAVGMASCSTPLTNTQARHGGRNLHPAMLHFRALDLRRSAVDEKIRARGKARIVGRQEQCGFRNFFRLSDTTDRNIGR